jgi:hypothetical protein
MNESPVFVHTYDLLIWLLPTATKFPRAYRFGLGERVVRRALDFQETLIAAGLKNGPQRRELLQQADAQLSQLRHLLRMCADLELFSLNQYEHISRMVAEVGRLLGAWLKNTQ